VGVVEKRKKGGGETGHGARCFGGEKGEPRVVVWARKEKRTICHSFEGEHLEEDRFARSIFLEGEKKVKNSLKKTSTERSSGTDRREEKEGQGHGPFEKKKEKSFLLVGAH